MNRIYMDNAATTRVRAEVIEAMIPCFEAHYGNASSVHETGRGAKKLLEKARAQVAKAIGADVKEIYFTSGGTEADNWALRSTVKAYRKKGNHIITSSVEHHGLLHTCEALEKEGVRVTYLGVDEFGRISMDELSKAIDDETILVSIMAANNEIGTIQPIEAIGKLCRERGVLFHTDAVQAVGSIPIDVAGMNIDMLSLAGHKFYGPKGVGALYCRKGVRLEPMIYGGAQERGRRAGTDNVPGAVGMGTAIELAVAEMPEHSAKLTAMRDDLIRGLFARIPEIVLNGHPVERLPNNANISIRYIEGESILLSLDMEGIDASSGSACTSGSLDPSHVLLAIGLSHEIAHGSLRLSLGRYNTQADVDRVLEVLPKIVARLRDMSPLFAQVKEEAKHV